jgi:hypothetical protein
VRLLLLTTATAELAAWQSLGSCQKLLGAAIELGREPPLPDLEERLLAARAVDAAAGRAARLSAETEAKALPEQRRPRLSSSVGRRKLSLPHAGLTQAVLLSAGTLVIARAVPLLHREIVYQPLPEENLH